MLLSHTFLLVSIMLNGPGCYGVNIFNNTFYGYGVYGVNIDACLSLFVQNNTYVHIVIIQVNRPLTLSS